MPDYYKLLGLAKGAPSAEVKSAYRALALKFHPDHNPNNIHVERQFQLISEAIRFFMMMKRRALRPFWIEKRTPGTNGSNQSNGKTVRGFGR